LPPSSGALCDDWERHDPEGRTVLGFNFFLLQADAIPAEGSRRPERRSERRTEQADAIPAEGSRRPERRSERRTERLDPITRAITGAQNGAITGAHLNRDDGGDGGDGEYGRVTKRLIKRFDCNERRSQREMKKKNGTAPEV